MCECVRVVVGPNKRSKARLLVPAPRGVRHLYFTVSSLSVVRKMASLKLIVPVSARVYQVNTMSGISSFEHSAVYSRKTIIPRERPFCTMSRHQNKHHFSVFLGARFGV